MKNKSVWKGITIALIFVAAIILYVIAVYQVNDKIFVNGSKRNYYIIQEALESDEIQFETLNEKNCRYQDIDENSIRIYYYLGDADGVIIPSKIDDKIVCKIDPDTFEDDYNLEIIKIENEIADNVNTIDDFEISEELSDDEYTVFITTKTYTKEYIEWLDFSDEDKEDTKEEISKFSLDSGINPLADEYIDIKTAHIKLDKNNITYTYDGTEHTPGVTVYNDLNGNNEYDEGVDDKLISGTHYSIEYKDNVDAGTATITVSGIEKGGYTDTYTTQFDIASKNITDETISVTVQSITYTGAELKPDITSVYDSAIPQSLEIKKDYTIKGYSNNINADSNAEKDENFEGSGIVTIIGKGNYEGERDVPFHIWHKEITDDTVKITLDGYDYDSKDVKVNNDSGEIDYIDLYFNKVKCTYTGEKIIPEIKITDTAIKDDEGNATVVSYNIVENECGNITDAGDENAAYISIQGGGNYKNPQRENDDRIPVYLHFTITQRKLANCTIVAANQVFTGKEVETTVTVTYNNGTNSKKLEEGKENDYIISGYNNNIGPGQATVTVKGTGNGNYGDDSVDVTFYIYSKSIDDKTVEVKVANGVYSGNIIKPEVKITDTEYNISLTEDTDYKLEYGGEDTNLNAITAAQLEENPNGVGVVKIIGMNNYSGERTENFIIWHKEITDTTEDMDDDTVKITLDGSSSCYKEVTEDGSGEITKIDIYFDKTNYTYTGEAITPTIKIVDNEVDTKIVGTSELYENKSYTILEYYNNINATDTYNAYFELHGTGNYKNPQHEDETTIPIYIHFNINKKSLQNSSIEVRVTDQTYTGSEIEPKGSSVVVYDSDRDTYLSSSDYTIDRYESNVQAGENTAKIWLRGTGNGNYDDSEFSGYFTINPKDITNNSSITVTFDDEEAEYIYNGDSKEPALTVGDTSLQATLKKDKDYTIEYIDNVDAGTATVRVEGIGNYTGTRELTFTISPKDMTDNDLITIELDPSTYIYNGYENEPDTIIKDRDRNNEELIRDTDYEVEYSDNINVGTATVVITGIGNYTGGKTITFEITPKDITNNSSITITLEPDEYIYNGFENEPDTIVKDKDIDNVVLVRGTDYEVTYSNNINAGTATVTITGKGNYTGTKTTTFKINPKDIGDKTIQFTLDDYNCVYSGSAICPELKGVDNERGETLINNKEYTFEYSDNVTVGTATITITGIGNYTGTTYVNFNVIQKNIGLAISVRLSCDKYTYDGQAKTPTVYVSNTDEALTQGQDYAMYYRNNVDAGVASLVIVGRGNYTGSVIVYFDITPKKIEEVAPAVFEGEYVYNGEEIEPDITFGDEDVDLVEGTDYDITYDNNINAGIATVTLTGKGNYTGTTVLEYEIKGKDIAGSSIETTLDKDEYVYDGEEIKPVVTIIDNELNVTLVENKDYELVYNYNLDAGIEEIIISGIGNYDGTKTIEVEVINNTEDEEVDEEEDNDEDENSDNKESLIVLFKDYIETVVDKELSLENIYEETSIRDFKENVYTNGTITIYENDEKVTGNSSLIKTGMRLNIKKDDEEVNYILIVIGDINSDGYANSKDLLKLSRYLVGLDTDITGVQYVAANVYKDSDKQVNSADLLKFSRVLVGLDEF